MYSYDVKKRVRYSETDKMGYLYYGNYAALYEIGRVETIRSLGVSYKDLEDKHQVMLPVLSLESRFLKPAYYDDLITIRSMLKELPNKLICFHHVILNEQNEQLNTAEVKLFFVNMQTNKRVSAPEFILKNLRQHFG